MLYTYLKLVWRHSMKNKLLFFINISGFALAMAVCMVVLAQVKDVLDYDAFHTKKDRTYRILTEDKNLGSTSRLYATSPSPLFEQLRQGHTAVERATRVQRYFGEFTTNHLRSDDDLRAYLVDANFSTVFDYPLAKGSFTKEAYTTVLSQQAARQFFGDKNHLANRFRIPTLGY